MNENELTINGLYYYDIDNNKKTLRYLEHQDGKYFFEIISDIPTGEILLTQDDLNKLEKL